MDKTLRYVLPHEALDSWCYPSVAALLDQVVTAQLDGFDRSTPWPGPHKNVAVWWTLADGRRVGWNENPSTGWSFPVLGKPRK